MADFIAVIRRAVDGLAENTPEMRVKVYERARGAVQRQLENMKPRPPEAMLQRQLEKLEAAIREVEGEHSEAMPLDEPAAVLVAAETLEEHAVHEESEPAPAPEEAVEEPVYEAPAEPAYEADAEPQAAEEPDHEQVAAPQEEVAALQEEAAAEEPVSEETYWHPSHEEEAPAEEWRAGEAQDVPAEDIQGEDVPAEDDGREELPAAYHDEDAVEHHRGEQYVAEAEEIAAEPVAAERDEPATEEAYEPVEPFQPVTHGLDHASQRLVEPVADFDRPQEFVEHSREEPLQVAAAAHFDPVWSEPAAEAPAPAPKDAETEWAEEELRQYSETAPITAEASARAFEEVIANLEKAAPAAVMPAAKESFSWETAAFDDLPPIEAGNNSNSKKPPVASHFDDVDIFAEVHGKPAPAAATPSENWREAKTLRGYDRRGSVAADDDDSDSAMDIDQIVASKLQGKNFRMEPKRRRFGIGTVLTLLFALILIGGGAYAGWMNREALVAMVDGLVSSAPSQSTKNEAVMTPSPGPATPAQPGAATPAQPPVTPGAQNTPAKPAQPNQQVASLNNDGSAANSKFTQRLLADGTETDSGPATVPGTLTAEGKSVAQQNVAAAETPAISAQGDAAPAETLTPNGPAASPQQAAPAVGSSEKMFLYEERIGQSSPTAIEGSVVWSVQHEAGQGGRQEATVQGNVTVPERNLSALVTFKRNSDPSLPASHLVEIVFSVPPNFEGGSIDSVQRISMKRTEQDRGDALIAVPAKITDDFHMIALNDYPDARKANLDLMSTRNWIDIPVTYRNGRRALLTMEKGGTGTDAFNTAIKEWTALGDVSTSQ